MDAKDDSLKIHSLGFDAETGEKLEPEEAPAERRLVLDGTVTGNLTGESLGEMQSAVTIQKPALEFAQEVSKTCGKCKHFDQMAWLNLKMLWEGSSDGVRRLNEMRMNILQISNDRLAEYDEFGERSAEQTLLCMGVCHPLTEEISALEKAPEPVIVHPIGGCPQGYDYFEADSTEAEKLAASAFDKIMFAASGEKE